jgi:hypothetical protein
MSANTTPCPEAAQFTGLDCESSNHKKGNCEFLKRKVIGRPGIWNKQDDWSALADDFRTRPASYWCDCLAGFLARPVVPSTVPKEIRRYGGKERAVEPSNKPPDNVRPEGQHSRMGQMKISKVQFCGDRTG